MKRRALLQSLAAAFVARPLSGRERETAAQTSAAPTTTEFTAAKVAALAAIADVVLPAAIGADGRQKAVSTFVAWHRNYREGAETGHSYGSSTLGRPTGAPPASRYAVQFTALDTAARTGGAASFATLPIAGRREIIEAVLNTPQPVTRMPARPTGANLIADFMGFYFNSPDASDLCYNAEIGRDACRTLDGSDRAPSPRRQAD